MGRTSGSEIPTRKKITGFLAHSRQLNDELKNYVKPLTNSID